ncbi:hypothetical protein V1477_000370 [Vespula maculifrons]|uniref:Uncharacterized protein n=2 Tax=Vespula TaxID=7451 RepID=A0A834MTS0_VESVU|nr:hypothetical protein HZH66_012123 [Vespula vulgaris]
MSQKARLIIDSWIPLLNYRTQDKEMTKKTMCYLFLVKYDWSMRFHGNRSILYLAVPLSKSIKGEPMEDT